MSRRETLRADGSVASALPRRETLKANGSVEAALPRRETLRAGGSDEPAHAAGAGHAEAGKGAFFKPSLVTCLA